MNAEWWEGPIRFLCGWWWLLLFGLAVILALFFTKDVWLPLLFL